MQAYGCFSGWRGRRLRRLETLGLVDGCKVRHLGGEPFEPGFSQARSVMNVAVVHEWLVTWAGSEEVLARMLAAAPDSQLYATIDFLSDADRPRIQGKLAKTTFLQRIPGIQRSYRKMLPLMPFAIEQLDLSAHDLIVSSNHAVAKGVLTGPNQRHISYVHSPMRYAWELQHQYLRESRLDRGPLSWIARKALSSIRHWDALSANRVDLFLANSKFIARRLWKTYRRKSVVLHPPVDTDTFVPTGKRDRFFVAASRLVPYKKIPMIVEAFRSFPQERLLVVGDGPERRRVEAVAGANVELVGRVEKAQMVELLGQARALLFAAEEDFGILPVEAQACGTPVIAYARGGVRETVLPFGESSRPTGLFFAHQTVADVVQAVQSFLAHEAAFDPGACREQALRFSQAHFDSGFRRVLRFAESFPIEQNVEFEAAALDNLAATEPTKDSRRRTGTWLL
jgi:glycosyltransferase involved in cell wall biosynthesis